MGKYMLYGMPIVGGGFLLLYPAALQLSAGFTAVMSLVQAKVLSNPWMRRQLGVHSRSEPKPVSTASMAVASRLNMYQPSSQALSAPRMASGITGKAKEKMSEAKGAASELMKSVKSLRGSTLKIAKRPPTINSEIGRAQALQERRLNRLAQDRSKR